ncbi:MAG: hypothetical protein K2O08_01915, partial [Clostridia bacterium]|nr:hypothetical protein [Clostridia bacterium]
MELKQNDGEETPPTDYIEAPEPSDGPVKVLKKNYYYLKNAGGDMTIRLVGDSKVTSLNGFWMIDENMWGYDEDKKALIIKQSYLSQFSVGAQLEFNIEYENSDTSDIYVHITDAIPPDIIGGEDGVIEIDTTELALNYKVFLGYDGKVLSEGTNRILRKVCMDGKKLSTA